MTAGVELSHNPQELRGEAIRRSNCCLSVHHLSLLIGTRLHSAVWSGLTPQPYFSALDWGSRVSMRTLSKEIVYVFVIQRGGQFLLLL